MDKKDCSNCQVGSLDRFTNIGSCPYFCPDDNIHCKMWKPMKASKKVNIDKEKLNTVSSKMNGGEFMEVTLYHQPSCPQCRMVEALLKQRNIAFQSNTDIDYMSSVGVKTTPTLSVDGTLMKGKEMIDWIKRH